MTTFNQIEKFDVGFDFKKGQPIPDETETIVAFHTLYNVKAWAIRSSMSQITSM